MNLNNPRVLIRLALRLAMFCKKKNKDCEKNKYAREHGLSWLSDRKNSREKGAKDMTCLFVKTMVYRSFYLFGKFYGGKVVYLRGTLCLPSSRDPAGYNDLAHLAEDRFASF